MGLPRVLTAICTHNYGQWLPGAIASAVHASIEGVASRHTIAVMDDGSTDGSMELLAPYLEGRHWVCPSYQLLDEREVGPGPESVEVHVYRSNESGGPSRARNFLIGKHWQDFDVLSILDADDEMYAGKLQHLMAVIADGHAIAYGDYDTVSPLEMDAEGNPNWDGPVKWCREYKSPYGRRHLERECHIHSGALLTREALEKTCGKAGPFYDPELRVAEDYDLWLRITDQHIAAHCPKALTAVRVGRHGSTDSVRSETWKACWTRVMEKARARSGG